MSAAAMTAQGGSKDRKLLFVVAVAMVALIIGVSVLAPAPAQDDPLPTIINTGPHGARAAFETLQGLGYRVARWQRPLDELGAVDAANTTLVLAQPVYEVTERKLLATSVERFLERGGRVVATDGAGALLLPRGKVKAPGMLQQSLCHTTPEGNGPLASAGSVEIAEHVQWNFADPPAEVEQTVAQRCGADAVVVQYTVGRGQVIWWSSAAPLTNAELKQDADLRLLLVSLGLTGSAASATRTILFDESLHGHADTLWQYAHRLGLPLRWVELQAALLGLLLVLSFSRRRGPVRSPVVRPRSSPVEFAESMGDLYAKGRATSAATDAARRRLLQVLEREAGLSKTTLTAGPAAIAEALQARFPGDWSGLREHLESAAEARHGDIAQRSALALVRALSDDAEKVRTVLTPRDTMHQRPQPTETL